VQISRAKDGVEVIHQFLLTHGHYGWSVDLPHEQRLCDVMGLEIGDGTAHSMKMIIAARGRQGIVDHTERAILVLDFPDNACDRRRYCLHRSRAHRSLSTPPSEPIWPHLS
jgi:hypothetical protein